MQVLAGPLLVVLAQRYYVVRMTKTSVTRVFINSYFCVVFHSRRSPFLEKDHLLADHTHVHQIVFNNGATDWRFHIPDRRPVYV